MPKRQTADCRVKLQPINSPYNENGACFALFRGAERTSEQHLHHRDAASSAMWNCQRARSPAQQKRAWAWRAAKRQHAVPKQAAAGKACRVEVLFPLVISFFFIITLAPLAEVWVNSVIGLWYRPIYVSHFSKVVQQKAIVHHHFFDEFPS